MGKWHNCKITFAMQSPVALSYPWIHFDGIIAHLNARKAMGVGYRLRCHDLERSPQDSIDNVIYHRDIAHASCSFLDDIQEQCMYEPEHPTIYARYHSGSIATLKYSGMEKAIPKINTSSGHYRSFARKLVTIAVKNVTFYARANIDKLSLLLQGLPGLGMKVAIGYGAIKSYKIEEIENDYSMVKDGKATRPIPTRYCNSYEGEPIKCNWTVPYWSSDYEDCVYPGMPCDVMGRRDRERAGSRQKPQSTKYGRCKICSRLKPDIETYQFSDSFTTADYLRPGDGYCGHCRHILKTRTYRFAHWYYEGENSEPVTFKIHDTYELLMRDKKTPFFIYFAPKKTYNFMKLLHRKQYNNDTFMIGISNEIYTIRRRDLPKLRDLINRAFEAGYNKYDLAGDIWSGRIDKNIPLYHEILKARKNQAWTVMVMCSKNPNAKK